MKMPGTNILRIFGICLTGKHHANVIMLKFKVFFFSVLLDFSLLNLEFRLTFFIPIYYLHVRYYVGISRCQVFIFTNCFHSRLWFSQN